MNNKEFEKYRDKIEKRSDELTAEELELIAGGVSGVKKGFASALALAALSAAPSINAQSTLSINNTGNRAGYSQVEVYNNPVKRYAYVSDVVDLKKALRNSDIDYILVTKDLYIKEDVRFPNDRKMT